MKDSKNNNQHFLYDFLSAVREANGCNQSYPEAAKAFQALREANSCKQSHGEAAKVFQTVELKASKSNDLETEQPSCSNRIALIQILNDDCLEYICKKLKLHDQINFSQTCRRFTNVLIMLSKVQYKMLQLEMMDELRLWEKLQFLKIVGPNIQSLKGRLIWNDYKHVVEFIGRYCTNIESVTTDDSELLYHLIEKMHFCMDSVISSTNRINKCLPGLIFLGMHNYEQRVNHICGLSNIKELSLEQCRYIAPYFKQICQNITNLHTLDVRNCAFLETSDFKAMVHHLDKLEDLKIRSTTEQYECIGQLPKLKRLGIFGIKVTHPLCHQLLIELVKHQSEQLEELLLMGHTSLGLEAASLLGDLKKLKKFSCTNNKSLDDICLKKFAQLTELEDINLQNCINITNQGLFNLFQKCPKLNRINFLGCKLITEQFIYAAFKLLKEQENKTQRKVPVLLLANHMNIRSVVTNTDKLKSSSNLIKVSMELFCNENDGLLEDIYVDMDFGVFRPQLNINLFDIIKNLRH